MVSATTSRNSIWPTKLLKVAGLHLDSKNPRLGRETSGQAPREIIQYLFEHDKAGDIAESIARHGYFANEPLLAVDEGRRRVIVEGNRRLAALKALHEPGLLAGPHQRRVERLQRDLDLEPLRSVPVTIAPSRRATDQLITARHVETPILRWRPENRASFILDKLEEGYSIEQLYEELRFTASDIQAARQTRAIADMARSLPLPEEVKAKIDSPSTSIFTTVERIFDSEPGRAALRIKPDPEHGVVGVTTKAEFTKGFMRLIEDLVLRRETSRSLNTNAQIQEYFAERVPPEYRVQERRGAFVPADIVDGKPGRPRPRPRRQTKKGAGESLTVLPKNLKATYTDSERIMDLLKELRTVNRSKYPNSGAVGLRVFFELVAYDYLRRTGQLDRIVARIERRTNGRLPHGHPRMRDLVQDLVKIAKKELQQNEANEVEKALRYDKAAPFSISDLHSFVHSDLSMPTDRDIQQFWLRTEPLIRLMLERAPELPK